MKANFKRFIFSILICQAAGIIGSFLTSRTVYSWYITLKKPPFAPPDSILGPTWILLYLLIGISLYLIWNSDAPVEKKRSAMTLFFIQLLLNTGWSFLFFFMKSPLAGFIDIVFMWILILVIIFYVYPLRKSAALLFIPYLLWVSFAGLVNFAIWNLNR